MTVSKQHQDLTLEDAARIIEDVKASKCFGRSNRQLKLFEYLLKKSLLGQSNDVTQYSVALDVLNRPESFDSTSDSIVRVEMHRLRANLEIYNAGEFEYSITVPPTAFEVIAKLRKQSFIGNLTKNSLSITVTVLVAMAMFCIGYVMPQLHLGSSGETKTSLCSNVLPNFRVNNVGSPSETQIYVETIIRSTIAQQTSFNLVPQGEQCSVSTEAPVFNLDYTLIHQGETFSVASSVISDDTDKIISSYHFTGDVSHMREGTDLYYNIVKMANTMSMPDSMTARMAINEHWKFESARNAYSCMIFMYDSFSGGTDQDANSVRKCLEDSLKNESVPLDNYGALAASYLDLARDLEPSESNETFKTAQSILKQDESAWMYSVELTIAKLYYEAERADFDADRFHSILLDAEIRYNSNPQVLFIVAPFYGYTLGRWEKAKIISDHAKKVYSLRDQSIFEVDAGYALMSLDGEDLMRSCSRFYVENSIYVNVIVNACARKAKDLLWYELTEKNLRRLNTSKLEEKLSVFEIAKHDFKFLETISDILKTDPST